MSLAQAVSAQENRVALVIGNSKYEFVSQLPNPTNDAADISASLKRLGFAVTLGIDLDYNRMRLAVRDFGESAADADFVLIYFAGHGIEIDNTNYLIPVNAQLKSDRDVEFEAIRLDSVIGAVDSSLGVKVILVDACRNNPFVSEMVRTSATRSIGRGLTRVDPGGVLVGYAARGGTVSLDGDGRNSPYAEAVLKYVEEPGLELGKMFRKVRDAVLESTDGDQEPFTYGSLSGDDIFLVPPIEVASTQVGITDNAMKPIEAKIIDDFATAESLQTLKAWNSFLERYAAYPKNRLVEIAVEKRDDLDAENRELQRKPWLDVQVGADGRTVILTDEDKMLVQKSLSYMGLDVGTPDGEFGPKTLLAISSARFKNGLSPGNEVDVALLRVLPDVKAIDALRSEKARVYDLMELPEFVDPRLYKAIENLGKEKIKFDYYEGRIYLAVLPIAWNGSWDSSRLAARNAGGHLVTIGSSAENQFVYQLFSTDSRFFYHDTAGTIYGPMIGLFQAAQSSEPSGGWSWETGEPLNFLGWSPGNPDNFNGRQNYARFYRNSKFKNSDIPIKYWDDTNYDLGSNGYIMEID